MQCRGQGRVLYPFMVLLLVEAVMMDGNLTAPSSNTRPSPTPDMLPTPPGGMSGTELVSMLGRPTPQHAAPPISLLLSPAANHTQPLAPPNVGPYAACVGMTCVGRCNQTSRMPEHRCNCDPLCYQLADCCLDFEKACPHMVNKAFSVRLNGSIDDVLSYRLKVSHQYDMYSECVEVNGTDDVVNMVTKCPQRFHSTRIKARCETPTSSDNIFMLIPVSTKSAIFRNKYCAICHGSDGKDFTAWRVDVECADEQDIHLARLLQAGPQKKFSEHVLSKCNLKSIPESPRHVRRLSKECSAESCNLNARDGSNQSIRLVWVACMTYWSPIKVNGVLYRNINCVKCKNAILNEENEKLDTKNYDCWKNKDAESLLPGKAKEIPLPSFSLLVNVNDERLLPVEKSGKDICKMGEVFDAISNVCSEVCEKGKLKTQDAQCLSIGRYPEQILEREDMEDVSAQSITIMISDIKKNDLDSGFENLADFTVTETSKGCSKLVIGELPKAILKNDGDIRKQIMTTFDVNCVILSIDGPSALNIFTKDFKKGVSDLLDVITTKETHSVTILRNHLPGEKNLTCNEGYESIFLNANLSFIESGSSNNISIYFPEANLFYPYRSVPSVFLAFGSHGSNFSLKSFSLVCRSPLEVCRRKALAKEDYDFVNDSVILRGSNEIHQPWEYGKVHDGIVVCDRYPLYTDLQYIEGIVNTVISSISLLCLLLTILTHVCFKALRSMAGIGILNLSIALFIAQLLFILSGIHPDKSSWGCKVQTVFQHFSWLASFCWTTTLAVDMTARFSAKLAYIPQYKLSLSVKYHVVSWGAPALLVITLVAISMVNTEQLAYFDDLRCILKPGLAAVIGFVIPAALTTAINLILFTVTIVHLRRTMTQAANARSDKTNQRTELYIYIRLTSLMGFNWIFGLLAALFPQNIALRFIFDIANGLQGVLVFVSFVFKKQILVKWKRCLCGCNQDKSNDPKSSAEFSKTSQTTLTLSKKE